jgi:hypothetical protein
MAVKSASLTTPEQDLELTNREGIAGDRGRKRPQPDAEDELARLRERINAARAVQPTDEQRHCLDCFEKGRNAAIRTIEHED